MSIAVVLIATLSSCCFQPSVHAELKDSLLFIFDGFTYIGQAPVGTKDGSTHQVCGKPQPHRIVVGQEYFFHHREPVDSLTLGRLLLPERLQKLGFTVIKTVDAEQGPIAFSSGGPLWLIRFVRRGCSGTISHEVDPHLLEWPRNQMGWEPADYILSIKGECK